MKLKLTMVLSVALLVSGSAYSVTKLDIAKTKLELYKKGKITDPVEVVEAISNLTSSQKSSFDKTILEAIEKDGNLFAALKTKNKIWFQLVPKSLNLLILQ